MEGGMYSTAGSGMLGLEMSLHHQPHHHHHQHPPPQQNPHQLQPQQHQPQLAGQVYPLVPKAKSQQLLTLSDEDEPGHNTEDMSTGGGEKRKDISPWHRMKWTDSMVRLLIMVVFYIGDEAGSEGNNNDPAAGGKKKGAGGGGAGGGSSSGGGVLQKKGKWKSVSRAMMERGFYVSPQQCEDKFNDLNKRYKRVNEILGKGTACRVVENQSLLDTMDHLTPKKKDEVKKLLNSKHLFFREMCAYHNSCGGGGGGGGSGGGSLGVHHSPEVAAEPSQQIQPLLQQQMCFHSSNNPPIEPISGRADTNGSKMVSWGSHEEEEDDEYEENDEDDDEDDEDEIVGGRMRENERENEEEEEGGGGDDDKCSRKRLRKGMSKATLAPLPLVQQLGAELALVVQDAAKSTTEKGQWMRSRVMQLEEQRVSYQFEAFEIEKQRLKWAKFSEKKEREMKRDKLKNERMRLENERMVLLLRQKELELLELQQQHISSNKRADPSSVT